MELQNGKDNNIIGPTADEKAAANDIELLPPNNKTPNMLSKGAMLFVIGASLVLNGCGSPEKAAKPNMPVATAPANPAEAATVKPNPNIGKYSKEVLPTVESLEMDASLISNPEALISLFVDQRMTEWINSGATPENAKAAVLADDMASYATKLAAEYDAIYEKALIVDGWQSSQEMSEQVKKLEQIHQQNLRLYFRTFHFNTFEGDKEPYKRGIKHAGIVSVTYPTNNSITIESVENDYDNADLNRVGENLTDNKKAVDNSTEVKPSNTFTIVKGKLKLSNVIMGQEFPVGTNKVQSQTNTTTK